jgi:hypothetical protein
VWRDLGTDPRDELARSRDFILAHLGAPAAGARPRASTDGR